MWEAKAMIVNGNNTHTNIDDFDDPINVKEALNREDAQDWQSAINDKYKSLLENKTWDVVPRPKDCNVIDTKWLF